MVTSIASSREATSSLRRLVGLLLAVLAAAPLGANTLGDALGTSVRAARRVAPELGVHVVDVVTGETILEHDPDRLRIAASNTKLITTAAALDVLGADYLYETPVVVRGHLMRGALVGDLGVIAGGDPNISGRQFGGDPLAIFRQWAARLRELGVEVVAGNIYLANGLFDSNRVHPDWPRNQLGKWYEAPVDALSFSDNCLLVRVRPGKAPGRLARVEMVPDVSVLKIRNVARTTSSYRDHEVAIYRSAGSDEVLVAGSVYRRAPPVESWVSVPDPVAYFGAALAKALLDEGVELTGEVRAVDELPEGRWRSLAVHRSDLLSTLEVTNRRSQNFYAEALLKLLGAEICDDGSWEAGHGVVDGFMRRVGISSGVYEMVDGSGMSRNNRFSPRQLTRLLVHMYHHERREEFVSTLPVSGGDDGRWKRRLAEVPYAGNVMAKTGTLRAVSALSGYARAASGKVYAFSILCNRVTSTWEARRAQDRIVRSLVDHG